MNRADHLSGVALVHDPALSHYVFTPNHPMQPVRVSLTLDLAGMVGLLGHPSLRAVRPQPATDEDLARVHTPAYIRTVRALGEHPDDAWAALRQEASRAGLTSADNTPFAGMHDVTSLVAGSTLSAARLVMSGQVSHAFSIAGGLHHAHADRASGFCIYNDLGVAIAGLRAEYPDCRVAYIDVDAHHGDGVQDMFYDDPTVLTISLHESGRYLFPGTGFINELGAGRGYGMSVNIPLEPYTWDALFLEAFDEIVPPLLQAFRPDIIVTQAGCDSHFLDPLTHLATTTDLWPPLMQRIDALAHDLCQGRLVVTGGGGYAIYEVVPRAWTRVLASLLGVSCDGDLPAAWLERANRMSEQRVAEAGIHRFGDDDPQLLPPHRIDAVRAATTSTLRRLRDMVFPLHHLPASPDMII